MLSLWKAELSHVVFVTSLVEGHSVVFHILMLTKV